MWINDKNYSSTLSDIFGRLIVLLLYSPASIWFFNFYLPFGDLWLWMVTNPNFSQQIEVIIESQFARAMLQIGFRNDVCCNETGPGHFYLWKIGSFWLLTHISLFLRSSIPLRMTYYLEESARFAFFTFLVGLICLAAFSTYTQFRYVWCYVMRLAAVSIKVVSLMRRGKVNS